jgi:LacI family transcriptional regulator
MMNIDYISVIERRGIQIFLLDTYKDVDGEMPGDVVKIDSFRPVVKLVRHLIDQGMRRIGFLNESSSIYETMHDRFDGYLYAMRQAGMEPVPELVMPDTELVSSEFYNDQTFKQIVKGYQEQGLPEAVVCGNDEIAKFLTQTLREQGIRVPEDVAVTGFDNDEEGMLDPFFTTVNVDAKWLGKRMVQCFLWRLGHPEAPFEKIDVSGRIIIRKSSVKRV